MRLALGGLVEKAGAVFDLELLGAAERHLQAVGQVVGHMIAANRQHPGVLDDPVGIDDVVGRSAADVDDQRAEFLLLVRQQSKRGGQAVEHDVIHLQLQPLDGANRILQPV